MHVYMHALMYRHIGMCTCAHTHAHKQTMFNPYIRTFNIQHKVNRDGSIIVEVTLKDVVTEVMTGAKTLKQLRVDIPDPALQILKQVKH